MASMNCMQLVWDTLGIDRVDMKNKMILIEEEHGTNANFLVNGILSNAIKNCDGVCLVLCHNSFGHYHNVGMRMGYDLSALKQAGHVTVVQSMTIVKSNIVDMHQSSKNKENMVIADSVGEEHKDIVRRLFTHVVEKYNEAMKVNKSVVLIVDDITHFLNFGLNIRDVMYFVRYLRSLVLSHPMSTLCIFAHTYDGDPQIVDATMIANTLRHMAHLHVTTKPFKTGHSVDASGKLIIYWRINAVRSKFHWTEGKIYLFKLLDWKVKIYAPGTASVLS